MTGCQTIFLALFPTLPSHPVLSLGVEGRQRKVLLFLECPVLLSRVTHSKAQRRCLAKLLCAFINTYIYIYTCFSVWFPFLNYIPFTGVLNLTYTRSQPGIEAGIFELKWEEKTHIFIFMSHGLWNPVFPSILNAGT